jgi:hypothetical protein
MFVAFMSLHILFCDGMCLIFYFAYRSRLVFKFEFESKEFENIEGYVKERAFLFSISLLG